jgi:hypothetical protein
MPASATSLRLKVSLFKRQGHFIRLRLQDDWTTLAKEKALVFRSIFFAVGDFHKPSEKIDQEGGVPCVIG